MAAVTICSDFGAQKNEVWHCFHCFPIYFPWSDGTGCLDLRFLNVCFNPTFSLSSFTFIKRLFSSSSLSAIRVVSSAYLRLLFLPAIWIPACASSSLAFLMMHSSLKLNKQGDNIQPWRTPSPIWNQSVVPCPVLTVASWPAYRGKCKSKLQWDTTSQAIEWLLSKNKMDDKCWWGCEEWKHLCSVDGTIQYFSCYRKWYVNSQKIKNRICDLAVPLWVYTPVKIRTLETSIHHAALFTIVKMKKQPKCLLEMKEKAKCSIYV